jgi:hypothetical protein
MLLLCAKKQQRSKLKKGGKDLEDLRKEALAFTREALVYHAQLEEQIEAKD